MNTPSPAVPALPELLARQFHEAYERLAPSFGYQTKPETREFDPESPNGKLMIAVCAEIEGARELDKTYVVAHQCDNCGHIGINDEAENKSACNSCDWSGDSPAEDRCPQCERDGTMNSACPECGGHYLCLAESHINAAPAQPPALVDGDGPHIPRAGFNPVRNGDGGVTTYEALHEHREEYTIRVKTDGVFFLAQVDQELGVNCSGLSLDAALADIPLCIKKIRELNAASQPGEKA